jgi:hypothetical protein
VKDARFGTHFCQGLPLGVRSGLQTLFGRQSLDIAEPGEKFDLSDMSTYLNLPIRRMIAAGFRTSTASSTTSASIPRA